MKDNAFAEVIESSLQSFVAQSWHRNIFAPFGSIVTIKNGKTSIYAVVYQVSTGSIDPQRTPFTYQKTEEELLAEQPQIFAFLKTTFSCLILGYEQIGKIYYSIAPEPPKMHSFVHPVESATLKTFFYQDTYLHTLFSSAQQMHNIDELLLAIFKQHQDLGILSKTKLLELIETFSLLTNNDYRRLKLFLQRVQKITDIY